MCNKLWTYGFIAVGIVVLIESCAKEQLPTIEVKEDLEETLTRVPEGFDSIAFPVDNRFSLSKWQIGKKLFYDPALSRDFTISCASCHKQDLGFADDVPVTPGVDNNTSERNSPTLANVAFHPYFTREGGVPTLEMQVLVPIQEHSEMDFNIVEICDRLNQYSEYIEMAKEAFGTEITPLAVTRALATFERTLISGNSAYDKFLRNEGTLTTSQIRGMELFKSDRANCASCHSGFNFTDYSIRNNGYESGDIGKMRLTADSADYSLFKVPTLRNVALTAPYMHDGSFSSLHQVLEHYNAGGFSDSKDPLIKPLNLNEQEINDLVSFLESLTDQEFISNKNFQE